MYKLMNGDLVVDILREVRYVRYLPRSKRWVGTDSQSAHGVMSADGSRIYLLYGRAHACPDELTSVMMVEISKAEYESLAMQLASQTREAEELREEIGVLKSQIAEQSSMLQAILAKL